MAVKMSDVAKLARVSTATVSRVLTDDSRVAPETKRQVMDAIRALGYRPNRLASSLRRNSSRSVLVVLPDITNPFFSEIVQGLEVAAFERNYHVLLGDTRNTVTLEREFIQLFNERFVDGMVLATARLSKTDLLSLSQRIPVVLACEYLDDTQLSTVSIDNVSASKVATQHLIDLGHKRIGFVTGPLEVVLSRDRLQGYREACSVNHLSFEERLVANGDFTAESGASAMDELLKLKNPPTAVVFSSDQMAIGALRLLKKRKINVPDQMSIVGFDDIAMSCYVHPELTTVHQPKYEIGYSSMNLLLDIVEHKCSAAKRVTLPHQLILRESSSEYKG